MSDNNEKQNNGLKIENEKTDTEDIRQEMKGILYQKRKLLGCSDIKLPVKKSIQRAQGLFVQHFLWGVMRW